MTETLHLPAAKVRALVAMFMLEIEVIMMGNHNARNIALHFEPSWLATNRAQSSSSIKTQTANPLHYFCCAHRPSSSPRNAAQQLVLELL